MRVRHEQKFAGKINLYLVNVIMSPQPKGGGGHIVFGADPVGVSVGVASFPHVIF